MKVKMILIKILIFFIFHIYIKPLLKTKLLPLNTPPTISSIQDNKINIFRTHKSKLINEKMYNDCNKKFFKYNDENEYNMIWFDDKDCDSFMKTEAIKIDQTLYDTYQTLKPGAYKADLFRLCILFLYSGVYIDSYATPYKSFKYMIRGCNSDFISVLDSKHSGSGIHNGFMIIRRRYHPFLLATINQIVKNVKERNYTNHPLAVTGPLCLSRSINKLVGRSVNRKFKLGKNIIGNFDLYLYEFEYGPSQYIYKNKEVIMSKKYSLIHYLAEKMKPSNYTKMWKSGDIFS